MAATGFSYPPAKAARHPGDTIKIIPLARGDERGDVRIQDYQDAMKQGIGRYKVGTFLPGITECSPGDTPKTWPEVHQYCATLEEADVVFDRYIKQALNSGWL